MDNWGTGLDMTASGFAKTLNLKEKRQNLSYVSLHTTAFRLFNYTTAGKKNHNL